MRFKYHALQPNEIRLLRPKESPPGRRQLHYYMLHVTPSDEESSQEAYSAISYCWGDPRPAGEVLIDGRYVSVAQILLDCLTALSRWTLESPGKISAPKLLWVDALCIDQDNLVEKSSEVQQMWRTYERASDVISWLGKNDIVTNSAIAALDQRKPGILASNHTAQFRRSSSFRYRREQTPKPWQTVLEKTEQVAALSQNGYFTRMWIVPELMNARIVTLLAAGDDALHITSLDRLRAWHQPRMQRRSDPPPTDPLELLLQDLLDNEQVLNEEIFTKGKLGAKPYLLTLQRHSDRLCSDPRDKIFALYGLPIFGILGPRPKPDYAMTLQEVALSVMLFLDHLLTPLPFEPSLPRDVLMELISTLKLSLGVDCSSPSYRDWLRAYVDERSCMARLLMSAPSRIVRILLDDDTGSVLSIHAELEGEIVPSHW